MGRLRESDMYSTEDLKTMQSWPLERKIKVTQTRIMEWHQRWEGNVHVAFSGGKDSTVLLDLARRVDPSIKGLFVNTGLEYPETVEFVKSLDNIDIIRPEKSFLQVIREHGYPVISKETAKKLRVLSNPSENNANIRNLFLTGFNRQGHYGPRWKLAEKWKPLIEAPFKVSEKCCDCLKKSPSKLWEKSTGSKPIIGIMASDSRLRTSNYLRTGCNSFTGHVQSLPMGFWVEQDVLEYLAITKIPRNPVYGTIKRNKKTGLRRFTGERRTGCIFCMFGVHLEEEPNRFQRMKVTHPKLYSYCLDSLGLREVLDYIGVNY